MPDPKLKEAMEEIKAVLRKHDITGFVGLASPTHSEYLMHLQASWTCIRHEEAAGWQRIQIRALVKDFPDPAAHKKVLEQSVGTIIGFTTLTRNFEEMLNRLLMMITKTGMQVEHKDWRDDEPPPEDKPRFNG